MFTDNYGTCTRFLTNGTSQTCQCKNLFPNSGEIAQSFDRLTIDNPGWTWAMHNSLVCAITNLARASTCQFYFCHSGHMDLAHKTQLLLSHVKYAWQFRPNYSPLTRKIQNYADFDRTARQSALKNQLLKEYC